MRSNEFCTVRSWRRRARRRTKNLTPQTVVPYSLQMRSPAAMRRGSRLIVQRRGCSASRKRLSHRLLPHQLARLVLGDGIRCSEASATTRSRGARCSRKRSLAGRRTLTISCEHRGKVSQDDLERAFGILRHALGVICSRIENATTMAGRCILGSRMTESAAEGLEVLMGSGLVQINLTLLTASPRLT